MSTSKVEGKGCGPSPEKKESGFMWVKAVTLCWHCCHKKGSCHLSVARAHALQPLWSLSFSASCWEGVSNVEVGVWKQDSVLGQCFLRGVTICWVTWNKVWNGEKSDKVLRGYGWLWEGLADWRERGLRTRWKGATGDREWDHIL